MHCVRQPCSHLLMDCKYCFECICRTTTFIQLKSRLINILMNAIQVEVDPQNTHMLLGGLMLCVQDSTLFEECGDFNAELRQTSPVPSDTNLLSSGIV